jgi:hypothetical protein
MSLENYTLEQQEEMARLTSDLSSNPATRKQYLKLVKQLRPDLHIAELEVEESSEKRASETDEKISKLEAKLAEKEAIENYRERRNALLKKGIVQSEDEIDEVEKIMVEKKIHDHETAAEYLDWMKRAAVPTPSGYNPSPLKGFKLNEFWKNPVQGARNEAAAALAELRKNSRPIGI